MLKFSKVLSSLDRLIDWFIPASLAGDREARQRARMFLVSHLLGPFIGNVVPAALYILSPAPGLEVAVLAISITSFWVFPFVLRAGGNYKTLVVVSVQILIFCILWSCYFTGGIQSPTLPWVLTIPLLAFFYLGSIKSLRLGVLALFAVNFAVFFTLCMLGTPTPAASPQGLQGLGIVSTLAAAGYVTLMALYYANILQSGVELETEMKGHLATAVELRRATSEAERAGAAKAEFLAKMSHELRTPLNAVIGYSQMLLEDAAAEGKHDNVADLEKIHSAGHHLLRLVNEVLDLSKIEAGKMEIVPEDTDVAALIRETVEACRKIVAKNGNELNIDLSNELGRVSWDQRKVQVVLTQLLENAGKFTEGGQVSLNAHRIVDGDQESMVIKVVDTGIGIPEETLPSLFESFSVGDDTSTSKYGGTGLGLALSLKLCQLMGGTITVESTVGVGSTFAVSLPVALPIPVVAATAEDDALPVAMVEEDVPVASAA